MGSVSWPRTCGLEEPGIESPTFQLLNNCLYFYLLSKLSQPENSWLLVYLVINIYLAINFSSSYSYFISPVLHLMSFSLQQLLLQPSVDHLLLNHLIPLRIRKAEWIRHRWASNVFTIGNFSKNLWAFLYLVISALLIQVLTSTSVYV